MPADQKKWASVTPDMNQRENKDPTGYRIGVAPSAEISAMMKQTCREAREYISKDKATAGKCLNEKEMEEHVKLMRGAVMIAYPAYHGMPQWDYVYLILEEKGEVTFMWPDTEWLQASESTAWFAGRELYRGKTFADQVNGASNEKSTFV